MSECVGSLPPRGGRSWPPHCLAGLCEVLGTTCTLIPAHRRGSMLTIIGTHLDSVYRAKIRFEASGVRTEATVSTGAGGHHPQPFCATPILRALCCAGTQHLPARRSARARGRRSGCCAAAQPSPLRARWGLCWGT